MTPREGITCRWCGYPVEREDDELCVQCFEWSELTGTAHQAVNYAAREAEKARYERRKQWEKRR